MKRSKQKRRSVTLLTAVLLMIAALLPVSYESEAATEKAVSNRSWESVEKVISTRLGTGYNDIGMCTGYLYWCLKNAYGVDWGDNSVVNTLEKKLIDKGITKVAEGTDGKLTSAMKPGDIVIFLQGSTGMHCAILGENGKLYHARSSVGVSDSPTLAKWMALPDSSKNCDRYRIYRGLISDIDISVSVTKQSADKELTEGNSCYSLAGAQYTATCGGKSITLTTDSSGNAKGTISSVPPDSAGKVEVKEIKPSKGYTLDEQVYIGNGSNGSVAVKSIEEPVRNPVELLLSKLDSETEESVPQKGGTLEGAVFEVDFYGTEDQQAVRGEESGKDPLRTWYFETDESGTVKWDEGYFAEGYESSPLYRNGGGGDEAVLPLGVIKIKEVKASEGYMINEDEQICVITGDGDELCVDIYQYPQIPEQIKRGDLEFCKIDGGTQQRMANIPFMIRALEENGAETDTGESHIVVTDANGYASTADEFNPHLTDTNANDAAWNGTYADSSMLDAGAGIWFGDVSDASSGKGALPYGRYVIDELPCENNEGYTLIKGVEIEVTRDSYTIGMGTLTNSRVKISTTASESDTGKKIIDPGSNVKLTDAVSYKGLQSGREYALEGILMDKATGEPVMIDGSQVTGKTTFTAESEDGSVHVDFELDARSMMGKETVVYETLYEDGALIAKHEDINNMDQTVAFLRPEIIEEDHGQTPGGAAGVVKTGDDIPKALLPALMLMTISCIVMTRVFMRRKGRKGSGVR